MSTYTMSHAVEKKYPVLNEENHPKLIKYRLLLMELVTEKKHILIFH